MAKFVGIRLKPKALHHIFASFSSTFALSRRHFSIIPNIEFFRSFGMNLLFCTSLSKIKKRVITNSSKGRSLSQFHSMRALFEILHESDWFLKIRHHLELCHNNYRFNIEDLNKYVRSVGPKLPPIGIHLKKSAQTQPTTR